MMVDKIIERKYSNDPKYYQHFARELKDHFHSDENQSISTINFNRSQSLKELNLLVSFYDVDKLREINSGDVQSVNVRTTLPERPKVILNIGFTGLEGKEIIEEKIK